jgi:hypothetical protein
MFHDLHFHSGVLADALQRPRVSGRRYLGNMDVLNAPFLLRYPATAARWRPRRGSGSRDGADPENYSFVIVSNRKHLQAISTSVDKYITSHFVIILDCYDGKVKVSDRVGSFGPVRSWIRIIGQKVAFDCFIYRNGHIGGMTSPLYITERCSPRAHDCARGER